MTGDCSLLIDSLVDVGDLRYPVPAIAMFETHDAVIIPVEVIGKVGDLFL